MVEQESKIKSVDFANFDYVDTDGERITLVNGDSLDSPAGANKMQFHLRGVVYGDLNKDGKDEAMAALRVDTGGSAILYDVYIYTLENAKPKLMWRFTSGDRGYGGLRRAVAENGRLAVELYGRDRVIGNVDKSHPDDKSYCCPTAYTRTEYKWRNKRFQQIGKPQIFPNPDSVASVLMPEYQHRDK
jgi:hypothetical protein